ncbi:MAG: hypothetical protein AAF065_13685 [Verrucomicrobiota bacterium]
MKYHHVIASCKSLSQGYHELFADLSEDEVRSRFVNPYLKGEHILCGNDQIDVFGITKLMIIRTEESSENTRKRINEESLRRIDAINSQGGPIVISAGSGYHAEDIKEGGEDVTSQFITGAVGSKKAKPWYVNLILTVTGGLLVAGLVWWLGWK